MDAAHQSSLSLTISQSSSKFEFLDSVMPSNHLILYCLLLLLPSIFPSIRDFSNELALCISWPNYWSFSFSIGLSSDYSGLEVSLSYLPLNFLSNMFLLRNLSKEKFSTLPPFSTILPYLIFIEFLSLPEIMLNMYLSFFLSANIETLFLAPTIEPGI